VTCAEFRELAALYATGGLDAGEQAAAAAHLEEGRHQGCFEALRAANDGVERLARSLVPARPDERVWRGLQARLGAGTQTGLAAMGWRERAAWGVAAAAALLLFASLSARRSDGRRATERDSRLLAAARASDDAKVQCARELAALKGESEAQRAALALLQSPSAQVVSLAPPAGAPPLAARALLDLAQRKGMLISSGFPAQPGKDYELWVIRGDVKQPAGLLRGGASGMVLAAIDPQLLSGAPPDALAVTLEPEGGVLQPSGPILLVGALPRT
jgi:hypothetical protein